MKIGTILPTFCSGDHAVDPDLIQRWAKTVDSAGFHSLWAVEHLVKPDTYRTSWLDPLVSLGFAAAVTSNIGLGTSILVLPQRRTAKVAQGIASLSYLACDRPITVGVGAGYAPLEFEAVGVSFKERGPRLTEGIEVLQRMLSGSASYHGRFHDFDDVQIDPVPNRTPIYLTAGGSTVIDGERRMAKPVLDRIIDTRGWIAAPEHPEVVAEEWTIIADHARERGVNPDNIRKALINYTHLSDPDATNTRADQRAVLSRFVDPEGGRGLDYINDHYLLGTVDEIREQLHAYDRIGLDQIILAPSGSDTYGVQEYETQLTRITELLLPGFEA